MVAALVLPFGSGTLLSSGFPLSSSSSRMRFCSTVASSPYSFSSSSATKYCRLHACLFVNSYSPNGPHHRRLKPLCAADPNSPLERREEKKYDEAFKQWDWWTAKFAGAANVPFLLLQLPQIILNFRNLVAGNKSALLAVQWLGVLTGLLGNLSLLSYFGKKKETEAMMVQALGVISMYIVISQLAIAEAMPFSYYVALSAVIAVGLIANFFNYFGMFPPSLWRFWEDFITVGGLSVLPQVMWSTFIPYIPNSILPGSIAFVIAIAAVIMARMGKLSEKGAKMVGALSGWTATLLFMWMPVAQMWTNYLNPDNIKGLSPISMLLAMFGNGLLIPRALFIRDFMWFTGSTWGTILYGWGNLLCMYCFQSISQEFFFGATAIMSLWLGFTWAVWFGFGYYKLWPFGLVLVITSCGRLVWFWLLQAVCSSFFRFHHASNLSTSGCLCNIKPDLYERLLPNQSHPVLFLVINDYGFRLFHIG